MTTKKAKKPKVVVVGCATDTLVAELRAQGYQVSTIEAPRKPPMTKYLLPVVVFPPRRPRGHGGGCRCDECRSVEGP